MINLELTEEHRLLEHTVRDWTSREVAPRIHDLDREHRFDRNVLPQMGALGLLGISVPTEYGGAGMDYISLGIACEELEYVAAMKAAGAQANDHHRMQLWAGQSAAMAKPIAAGELVREMWEEATKLL